MVTDKLYCVDLLAKLLDSSLTCDIISSPNSTVKDGIHILDYLTACRIAFLTSIFSQRIPSLSSNALHMASNIFDMVYILAGLVKLLSLMPWFL